MDHLDTNVQLKVELQLQTSVKLSAVLLGRSGKGTSDVFLCMATITILSAAWLPPFRIIHGNPSLPDGPSGLSGSVVVGSDLFFLLLEMTFPVFSLIAALIPSLFLLGAREALKIVFPLVFSWELFSNILFIFLRAVKQRLNQSQLLSMVEVFCSYMQMHSIRSLGFEISRLSKTILSNLRRIRSAILLSRRYIQPHTISAWDFQHEVLDSWVPGWFVYAC